MKQYHRHTARGGKGKKPENRVVVENSELAEILGYCSNGASDGDGRYEHEIADCWVELWSHRLSEKDQVEWHELFAALQSG